MDTSTDGTLGGAALLRLLQLVSPALPVGMYAYSQGLEPAVELGHVRDEASLEAWILGLLEHPLARVDLPVLARLYEGWRSGDGTRVAHWNDWLFAARESAELQREDRHLGGALARLLAGWEVPGAGPWTSKRRVCFATPFALAAVHMGIPPREAAIGYLWSWAENQVAAATRLLPLGQTAAQGILYRARDRILAAAEQGLACEEPGFACPGLAIASAWHETQYSRLFRS